MSFQSFLPSLESFSNIELGLHGLPTQDTSDSDDDLPPSIDADLPPHIDPDSDNDIDITTNTDCSNGTTTTDIFYNNYRYIEDGSDSDTFDDSGLPSNMKGLWNFNQRKRKRREKLIHRNKTNSPNIYHHTNKRNQNNWINDKCPWELITSPTITASLCHILLFVSKVENFFVVYEISK